MRSELDARRLRGFRLGGDWKTTDEAVINYIEARMSGKFDDADKRENAFEQLENSVENIKIIPTLAQMRQVPWKATKFDYTWPDGATKEDQIEAYDAQYQIGKRPVNLSIGMYKRPAAGQEDRARVIVYLKEAGAALYPVVEFAGANDFVESGLMASVIKHPDGKHVRPGDTLPAGYEDMPTAIYNEVVTGRYAAHSVCVIVHKDDHTVMGRHALLRLRQRDRI